MARTGYHRWKKNECSRCELRRKLKRRRAERGKRSIWVFKYQAVPLTEYAEGMPDCPGDR